MTLQHIEIYSSKHRIGELHNSAPQRVPDGYPFSRKTYKPTEISLRWSGDKQPESAVITGTVLRKDGTPRKHLTVVTYKLNTAPIWVKELAQELHAHV